MSAATNPKPASQPQGRTLTVWEPEDHSFWQSEGRAIAQRNLWISIPALLLAFVIWQVWSIAVPNLKAVGFHFSMSQMFWLVGLAGLSGGTLRIFYSFMVPIFGGRLWTTLVTASLLIPAIGIGYAVQDKNTPYAVFAVLALLAGLGGGNFASSMANISFFFPRAQKGNALALNAGFGNLGVSVVQLVVPLVLGTGILGAFAGGPQVAKLPSGATHNVWLQNAAFIWIPFIVICVLAAWFGMNDIAKVKASFSDQAVIFKRKHNWLMCWLYMGTFGSFIGYAAGFPVLTQSLFPEVWSKVMPWVFLGPLIGALSRSFTGWLSDKVGGARVSFWVFIVMILAVVAVIHFMSVKSFPGYYISFMILFAATGVGNASTFQMIPNIMRQEMIRLMPNADPETRQRQTEKESAAITGFTSAIAAYGFFLIPAAYGPLGIGPKNAMWIFLAFYVVCVIITFAVYSRKGGVLFDVERYGKFWTPAQSGKR
ncbi:MAG: MFS transporter [Burkholderiaceae bacterium]|jgi:NNP family nitrate/nitrite transporter-like MFS transporter|nr:MFS transporter [Burkholderiaceae bacterium]